ncbi:hypothetical protein [Curvibacter delicatus]|jgi:hypothetical protein|uniref:hypothetical protein n=1 Tax=Curvibacter delicatus TaxID=80879 RepID=UPI000A7DA3D9|nr:hypothetical protein [Curvibacter delicatus]
MTTSKRKQGPATRRRKETARPSGRNVALHELRGRAYFMLPAELHTLVSKSRLEQIRREMESQVLRIDLNLGRRLVRLCLPTTLMIWPPEPANKTARKSGKGAKQKKEPSA